MEGWRSWGLGGDNDIRCRRVQGWVDGGRTGGRERHSSVTFNNSLITGCEEESHLNILSQKDVICSSHVKI